MSQDIFFQEQKSIWITQLCCLLFFLLFLPVSKTGIGSIMAFFSRDFNPKFLSGALGFSEPIGALIGFFLLRSLFDDATFGLIFAAVAGILVYISLDEPLPTAEECGEHHIARGGLTGMIVMSFSLLVFT
jgi:zinc transporter ZupT